MSQRKPAENVEALGMDEKVRRAHDIINRILATSSATGIAPAYPGAQAPQYSYSFYYPPPASWQQSAPQRWESTPQPVTRALPPHFAQAPSYGPPAMAPWASAQPMFAMPAPPFAWYGPWPTY